MRKDEEIANKFKRLRSRLRLAQKRYNPTDVNLHFEGLAHGDADLYPTLLKLAGGGFKVVNDHHSYFSHHALYDDGMFWYGLFVMVSVAASRVGADRAQAYVPEILVDRLLKVLCRISRYSTVHPGDIVKRNHEALASTLLEFYSERRVRMIRESGKGAPARMRQFLSGVVQRVEDVRSERSPIGQLDAG